jgi:FAD:protein FMN transferase
MGTRFEVRLVGEDPAFLEAVGTEALDLVDTLEERLSHYIPHSEICDLNSRAAQGPVLVLPSLLQLLQRGVELSEASGGAFDFTAGPLVKCWGFFRGQGEMPEPADIEAALGRLGSRFVRIDPEERTVRFEKAGMEIHLGAIGKGYAIDEMVALLRSYGIRDALLHGGTSTVYGMGSPPEQEDGWAIGLRDPRKPGARLGVLKLKDRALSVSGDYQQFFEHEGRRYGHVLDPRTGWPAQGIRSAAVLAESATDTDALSTAAFVSGVAGARALCERFPGLGAILVPEPELEDREPDTVVLGEALLLPQDDDDDL